MSRTVSRRRESRVLTYPEVCQRIAGGRAYLLLGNGFSIACDPIFRYHSLYDAAIQAGLSPRAQRIFQRMGTNNFEGVMKLLEDSHWVARTYGLIPDDSSGMADDLEVIQQTLVRAIATSHLGTPGDIDNSRKTSAARFLSPFRPYCCRHPNKTPIVTGPGQG
jgi:hypothetical protein